MHATLGQRGNGGLQGAVQQDRMKAISVVVRQMFRNEDGGGRRVVAAMQPLQRKEGRSEIRAPISALLVPLSSRYSVERLVQEAFVLRRPQCRQAICRHAAGHMKVPPLPTG